MTTSNDNDVLDDPVDAHGQAAMLLVESLIHTLIARSVLTVADAVEIVETASEVGVELDDAPDGSRPTLRNSLAILAELDRSLRIDLTTD